MKQSTDARGICVLVVHHTRKQRVEDIFEMISGTYGLMGAADGAMILNKEKRTSMNATLAITGRDQPDQTIYLVRDEDRLVWQFERSEVRPWELQPAAVGRRFRHPLGERKSCNERNHLFARTISGIPSESVKAAADAAQGKDVI